MRPFTIVDVFRRKQRKQKEGFLAYKPAPWGETIIGTPSPPTGIRFPVQIKARGCQCDKSNWYTCPKEKVNLKKGYTPRPYSYLYWKCGSCGIRWNPWPPGHSKFIVAAKAIGRENTLDHTGEQYEERTRIDLTAIRYADNDND